MDRHMKFTIREAAPSDVDVIVEFNELLALETEKKQLDRTTLRKGVERVLSAKAHGVYYVAVSGDIIVGQLLITHEWSDWRNGEFWWIQSVYVRDDWRGKRVYSSLHDHVVSLARADRTVCGVRLYVEEENARARATYEKLGMMKTPYVLYEIDFTTEGRL